MAKRSPRFGVFFPALSAHTFDLWDVASGKLLHSFAGHREGVTGLAFAADGKTLFSSRTLSRRSLLAWNAATGRLRGQIGEQDTIAITASPCRRMANVLAACGDSGLQLWHPATGKKLRTCVGTRDFFVDQMVAWSADNRSLVSSGHANESIHVWDAATGKELRPLKPSRIRPHHAILSPDGESVAAGGYADGTIHLWSVATGQELRKLVTPPKELRSELRSRRVTISSMVYSLAFHPDGSVLASGGSDG